MGRVRQYKYKISFLLIICLIISIFFSLYKIDQVPPCLNADEAAHGYNAYSMLKTGRDEYGNFLPTRLVSFLDYKLPLYSYLSIPIIAIFGLSDFSTRFLNILVALSFVPLMYWLSNELFNNKKISILASFFVSCSPWVFILTRHAHEGALSSAFILLSLIYLIKFHKQRSLLNFIVCNGALLGAGFSYHTARLFFPVFVFIQLYLLFPKNRKIFRNNLLMYLILFITVIFTFYPDFHYGANIVANLFYLRNSGFQSRLLEYRTEHGNPFVHNVITESIRDVSFRYLQQLSPDFLIINGDKNWRFGFQNIGLITPIEYLFIFVGIGYMLLRKERYRWFVGLFMIISPLPNALTWQDASITRSYFLIFPMIFFTSYGVYYLYKDLSNNLQRNKLYLISTSLIILFCFFLYNSFDVYFNHYPKRALTIRAWQCGYKELVQYIADNYSKFETFYITDRHGQPYIFLLYYLQYDPEKYQKMAKISAPDKYGFGQIYKFDKFVFDINVNLKAKKQVFIGYPEAFNDMPIDKNKIKHIKVGTEDIFWIWET